jgi:hypothetical protein
MKKLLLITSILLLAAACNKQAQVQPAQIVQPNHINQNNPPAQTQQQTEVIDKATGWKIYKNSIYAFEIEYPKDWQIDAKTLDAVQDSNIGLQTLAAHFAIYPNEYKAADGFMKKIEFSLSGNPAKTNEAAKKLVGNFVTLKKLGNYVWAEGKTTDGPGAGSPNLELINNYLSVHSNVWELDKEKTLAYQILGTFKFTK